MRFLLTTARGILDRPISIIARRDMSSKSYATVSYVTTPNETVARQLSRQLVEQRLAACVNIVKGVESIYEWQGKIEQDTELMLIVKSDSSKSEELAKFVQENHPYDCPEVVTMKVDSGSAPYLRWIHTTLGQKPLATSDSADHDDNSKGQQ